MIDSREKQQRKTKNIVLIYAINCSSDEDEADESLIIRWYRAARNAATAPKTLNKIMQVNMADQPYWATIQPITGPSRNVPMEPTPTTQKCKFHIDRKEVFQYSFFQTLFYLSVNY